MRYKNRLARQALSKATERSRTYLQRESNQLVSLDEIRQYAAMAKKMYLIANVQKKVLPPWDDGDALNYTLNEIEALKNPTLRYAHQVAMSFDVDKLDKGDNVIEWGIGQALPHPLIFKEYVEKNGIGWVGIDVDERSVAFGRDRVPKDTKYILTPQPPYYLPNTANEEPQSKLILGNSVFHVLPRDEMLEILKYLTQNCLQPGGKISHFQTLTPRANFLQNIDLKTAVETSIYLMVKYPKLRQVIKMDPTQQEGFATLLLESIFDDLKTEGYFTPNAQMRGFDSKPLPEELFDNYKKHARDIIPAFQSVINILGTENPVIKTLLESDVIGFTGMLGAFANYFEALSLVPQEKVTKQMINAYYALRFAFMVFRQDLYEEYLMSLFVQCGLRPEAERFGIHKPKKFANDANVVFDACNYDVHNPRLGGEWGFVRRVSGYKE